MTVVEAYNEIEKNKVLHSFKGTEGHRVLVALLGGIIQAPTSIDFGPDYNSDTTRDRLLFEEGQKTMAGELLEILTA